MAKATYFIQGCPTCGRRLQVRVEYLGKRMSCEHCRGHFVAADPASARLDCGESQSDLIRRADELLRAIEAKKPSRYTLYPR